MKQKMIFTSLLGCAMLLCACNAQPSGETTPATLEGKVSLEPAGSDSGAGSDASEALTGSEAEGSDGSEMPADDGGAADEAGGAQTDGTEVRLLKESNGGALAASSDGYYGIYWQGSEGTANIIYTDVATAQRIYLSPDLASDHQSEADPSWLDGTMTDGGCFPFVAGDHLFLANSGAEAPGALHKAELNGSGRTKLAEFEEYDIIWEDLAFDGQWIYVVGKDKDWEDVLLGVNSEDGTVRELCRFPNGGLLYGAFGDQIIIKSFEEPESYDESDPMEQYDQLTAILYGCDIDGGEPKEFLSWRQVDMYEAIEGDRLYGFDVLNDCLKVYDLSDGSEEILIGSLSELGINGEEISYVDTVKDGHMIFSMNGSSYFLDLSAKTMVEAPWLSNTKIPMIFGTYGDQYLVSSGDVIVYYDGYDPGGRPAVLPQSVIQMALIDQEDYWKCNYEFTIIKDVFLED